MVILNKHKLKNNCLRFLAMKYDCHIYSNYIIINNICFVIPVPKHIFYIYLCQADQHRNYIRVQVSLF